MDRLTETGSQTLVTVVYVVDKDGCPAGRSRQPTKADIVDYLLARPSLAWAVLIALVKKVAGPWEKYGISAWQRDHLVDDDCAAYIETPDPLYYWVAEGTGEHLLSGDVVTLDGAKAAADKSLTAAGYVLAGGDNE